MRRAHARSALRSQTFWFRKHMGPPAAGSVGDPDEYEEMTVEEILTGKGDYFPGLITLVHAYLEAIGCDPETGEKVGEYMELKTPTLALTLAQTLTLTLALALTLTLALHGL